MTNIATNIANVQTNAYKEQRTSFQTLLNHVTGTNKSFFAVDTVDTRSVDKQGLILTTQRQLDLAIDGNGLFVTNVEPDGARDWQFTRDGSFLGESTTFETDTDGNGQNDQGAVLTTTGGNTVFGWPANADGTFDEVNDVNALRPVTINSNQVFPPCPTTTISLQANVSAEDIGRQSVGLPFIDASGEIRTDTIGFNASVANDYTLDAASLDQNNQPVAVSIQPSSIVFSGFGTLETPSDGLFTLTINDATGPQVIILALKSGDSISVNWEHRCYQSGARRASRRVAEFDLFRFRRNTIWQLFKLKYGASLQVTVSDISCTK